jgi:hypothetical protein
MAAFSFESRSFSFMFSVEWVSNTFMRLDTFIVSTSFSERM